MEGPFGLIGILLFQNFDLSVIVISYMALLLSLCVHEACHAAAAYQLEDDTAYNLGRLSLNPLVHMDPIGTFLFPLLGMSTGLPFIGWAKPVPVNPVRFKRSWTMRKGMAWVSAAGPLSNLALSLLFLVLISLWLRFVLSVPVDRLDAFRAAMYGPRYVSEAGIEGASGLLLAFGGRMVIINVMLAIFNMIPLGPLDGAGVLLGFLPYRAAQWFDKYRSHMYIVLLILVFTRLLWVVLGPVVDAVYSALFYLAHLLLGA